MVERQKFRPDDRTFDQPVLGMYLEVRRGGYSYIVARVAVKGHALELSSTDYADSWDNFYTMANCQNQGQSL
jgi:hypothetical protein